MYDFTLICWELKRRTPMGIYGGYPCIGYPQADGLVPAFQKVGARIQTLEFCDYATLGLTKEQDKKEPFRKLGMDIESKNVLIEWDGITSHRDFGNIWKWGKKVYTIPHNGSNVSGNLNDPVEEKRLRKEITEQSHKVIFAFDMERAFWKEFECNKYLVMNPPTRMGKVTDKQEARRILGIDTKYALIAWGNYEGKDNQNILPWLDEWRDTALLFVGSGCPEGMKDRAVVFGDSSKYLYFTKPGISDLDADIWFSASDLCSYLRSVGGSSTPTYILGQGKGIVAKNLPLYQEYERLGGVITGETDLDVKRITRELLLDEEKRKILEQKSYEYAKKNSYEKYAIRLGKLMGFDYKEKES